MFAKAEVFLMVSKKKFFGKSQEEGYHSQPTLYFQFLVVTEEVFSLKIFTYDSFVSS